MPRQDTRPIAGWAMALLSIYVIGTELPRAWPGAGLLDFGSFIASARAAQEGLNPYDIHPLTFHIVLPGFETWNPNLNPPISVLLFQLFDVADPAVSFRLWWGLSLVSYAAMVGLLVARYGGEQPVAMTLWAFGLAGFWDTLVLGQIYLPLALAGAGAWLLLERGRGFPAGLLIGLVAAMKPNFLVWPVLLFLAGQRRAALTAAATTAIVSAMPLFVFGPEIYRQWFELFMADRERVGFLTNASLAGLFARMGVQEIGLVFSVLLLAAASLWTLLRRPHPLDASALGILAGLLASPLAWVHYTLFLVPYLMSRWRRPLVKGVAALLMVPVPFVIAGIGKPAPYAATLGSIYNWALLLCLLAMITEQRAVSGADRRASALSYGRVGSSW